MENYPTPPPDFYALDIDDWLINGKKPRKARKKKENPLPWRQLEFDFNNKTDK